MIAAHRTNRPYRPMSRIRRAAQAVSAAGVCALLLAGCGDDGGGDGDGDGGKQSPSSAPSSPSASGSSSPSGSATGRLTEDQRERKALVPDDKTGYRKAVRTATGEVPGGTVTGTELERGSGDKPVWVSKVAAKDGTEHDVEVDAASGKVVHSRTDPDQDSDDKRELKDQVSRAKASSQQAVDTATGRTKGTVTSVELDDTDTGTPAWSVDIVTTDDWNKTTYDVDATNGKILRKHVDRD